MPSVYNPTTRKYQEIDQGTYDSLIDSFRSESAANQPGGREVYNPFTGGYHTLSAEDEALFFPASTRPVASYDAAQEPERPTLADYGRSVMSGGAHVVAGLGWLVDRLDGETGIGEAIENLGRDAVDYWNDGLSESAKDALSREFVRRGEDGSYEWGDPSLHTVGLMGAQSLLGTAAGAGIGAGATKVLQTFANPAGRAALVTAATNGSVQAQRKLKLVDRLIGAVGFGAGEGTVGGMSAGFSVKDQVLSLSDEELYSSERFRQIYNSTDSLMDQDEAWEHAKQTVADEAASLAGLQAGLTTGLLGAPMGAYFGPLFSKVGAGRSGSIAKGAAGEAAQEFLQSGAEQRISNEQVIKAGGDVDPWQGVLNAAVGGAMAGAPLGGVLATADRSQVRAARNKPEDPERNDLSVDGVNYSPLVRLGQQAMAAGATEEQVAQIVNAAREKGQLPPALQRMHQLVKDLKAAEADKGSDTASKVRPTERPQETRSRGETNTPLAEEEPTSIVPAGTEREVSDEAKEAGVPDRADSARVVVDGVNYGSLVRLGREAIEAGATEDEVQRIVEPARANGQLMPGLKSMRDLIKAKQEADDTRSAEIVHSAKPNEAKTQEKSTVKDLPDSVLVAVAESTMPDGDPVPLSRFTPDEQQVLRDAGLVSESESTTGERFEGVEPRPLFDERDRRFNAQRAARLSKPSDEPEIPVESTPAQVVNESVVSTPDELNAVAQDAATSPANDRAEPTDSQKSAGNYRKPRVKLPERPPIRIENPMDSTRTGRGPGGAEWSRDLQGVHYGYFEGTAGADNEEDGTPREGVDVYVGPNATDASLPAFVIDQKNPDGSFDEHKVVLGFKTEKEARKAYLDQYEDGWDGIGAITAMSTDQLRAFLRDEGRTAQPVAYQPGELEAPKAQPNKPARPADAAEERLRNFLAAALRRFAMEQEGQAVLDDMIEDGTGPQAVSNEFWNGTYFALNAETQARFQRMLRGQGFKPGDVGSVEADGTQNVLEDWVQVGVFLGEDLPESADNLEGTERGYVALMKWANDQRAAGQSEPDQTQVADPERSTTTTSVGQIEDFGEVLEGARKHVWEKYQDRLSAASELDIAALPLSKSWPAPDYQRLLDKGADASVVAFIRAARDEIPTKPKKAWKRREWVKQVEALRNFSEQAIDGRIPPERIREDLGAHPVFKSFADRVELYATVGHAKSLKGIRIAKGQYSMLNGEKIDPPRTIWTIERAAKATAFSNWPTQLAEGNTRAELIANFKRNYAKIDTQPRATRQVRFAIYSYRTGPKVGRWVIGKKVGKERVDLREFDNVKEARSYLEEHHDDLVKALDQWKSVPAHRKESDAPRVGADHRNGADITPETFAETFGFRGVQFGNYVEGGRRQQDLNQAYDALLDLGGLLDVPARSLSLNGELGLAFGARGKGGKRAARAHYEADTVVINLTKREGAGSLAHEWWHALDNYFSKRRGNRTGFVSEDAQSGRPPGSADIRPEVLDAYVELATAFNKTSLRQRSRGLDRRRSKPYWSMGHEMSARAFESYVVAKLQDQGAANDYLANIVSEDYWKAAAALGVGEGSESQSDYPYPTAAEIPVIRAGFDALFDTIESRTTDEGSVELYSRAQETGVSGRTAEQVHAQLAEAIDAVRPLLDVQVVQSVDDLPPDAHGSDVEGAYFNRGVVYLVADNLSENRVDEVFRHEVFGHAAMERHPDFPKWMQQILNAKHLKGGVIAKLAVEVESRQGALDPTTEAKEIIALMAERKVDNGLLDRIVAALRQFFRRIGLLRDVSEAEIRTWLSKGRRRFLSDTGSARRDDPTEAPVFSRTGGPETNEAAMARVMQAITGDIESSMGPPQNETQLNRFLDEAIFRFQDKFNYLYKAQKTAARERGLEEMPEAEDAYLAELRYHGMVGAAIEDFQHDHVDPLVEAISKSAIAVEDVEHYLHARHAPEANAQLRKVNPDRKDNEALSGMSDAEAAAVIDGFRDDGTLAKLEALAVRVDAITKAQRDLMVESGLESAESIQTWEETYEYYVPLQREGLDKQSVARGRGHSVTGRQRRRAGSQRPVAHIVAQVVAQHEATIIRAQKNQVAQAMLEFATNNPNPDLYEVDKVEFQPTFGADGLVTHRQQSGFQFADNVQVVKVDGQDHTITFNERNRQAQRIAHAMKNLGAGDSGPIVNVLTKVMRYLALVNTGANPEFILSNFPRDLQTAVYNISDTEADTLKWKIVKDVGKAWRGIRAFQQEKDHAWASYFDEFRKAGAQTGWLGLYSDVTQRADALVKRIEELSGESSPVKIRAGMRAVVDFIERENTAVENAIRLSAFVHSRRAGMSKGHAARLAKELTVNFNRKGDYGQVVNALYLFYNASIQGSARIVAAASRSPKVRKLIGATVVFAMFLDMLNRALSGDDDDEKNRYDKVPDYVKERNLIIMLPEGRGDYIKIPLPWGYNVFHVLGQVMGEALSKRGFKTTEGAVRVADAVFGAFNPIGGEGSIAQVISPTLTDPIVQWSENKDWAGRPLRPESNPFDVDKPDSQQYWNSVRSPSRWITEKLNELTGGSKIRPGAVDVSPEWIDLLIDSFTGGAGRFVSDSLSTPVKAMQGDEIASYEIPLIRKLYGQPGMGTLFQDYYRNADAVRVTEKEARHFMQTRDQGALNRLRRERPGEYALIGVRKKFDSQLRKLRQRRNQIEASNVPDGLKRTQLQKVNEQIEERMNRFNRLYNQRVGE